MLLIFFFDLGTLVFEFRLRGKRTGREVNNRTLQKDSWFPRRIGAAKGEGGGGGEVSFTASVTTSHKTIPSTWIRFSMAIAILRHLVHTVPAT